MPSATIIGGTGLLGRAVARRLRTAGWSVTVTGRDPGRMPADLAASGVRFAAADRDDAAGLAAAVGQGCDLLVDCICFTAAQARLVLPVARNAGSIVMISSKAVYVDDAGNHSNSADPPRFAGPVTEDQPTVRPGDMPYDSPEGYGANKVAAEQVLLDSGLPVTVLRPSKVHGEGARPPRSWYFVKRALDRRPAVLLAGQGGGADHPSAAVNIAALVEVVADRPGRRILNAADPDAPDGLTISRIIAALTGHDRREVLLDDDAPAALGRHPWHRVPPVALDASAARALGYRPVGDFAATVTAEIGWLLAEAGRRPGWAPPGLDDDLGARWFDYPAEDAWLETLDPTWAT
ncbi:NAD-dependent epimerase/dehydratase family protein [Plantactinospora siamensis]|uniref:NAD-dependent epimerase/dehydratase family protein n=1 Tax=Plantactinospora siamensis TaxID=555372 RepID=A0ABV6NZW8_9ACTN